MTSAATHFWFGRWIGDSELDAALAEVSDRLDAVLSKPFPLHDLLIAADAVAGRIAARDDLWAMLRAMAVETTPPADADAMLDALSHALRRDSLEAKLRRELGTVSPNSLQRRYPDPWHEAWRPLGCVVHVMPSNVFSAAALGLIEGLLVGNVNVVKTSGGDTLFAQTVAAAVCEADHSGRLADYMAVARISSGRTEALRSLFAAADAISAWGGEEAISRIRALAPAEVPVIAWGHRISFAYVAADRLNDGPTWDAVAGDVCRLEQQACSSPQTVFVDCADDAALDAAADRLAEALGRVAPTMPRVAPDTMEAAEITTVVTLARLEEPLGLARVIEGPDTAWRVLVDRRPGLRPSPLFRTIWVTRLKAADIGRTLRPMRAWLQTAALACGRDALGGLSDALLAAGVTRITRPGDMIGGYHGAPHDGVYALQRLSRRVSVDLKEAAADLGSFDQLAGIMAAPPPVPVLDKSAFQARDATADWHDLVFRSGGSSGQVAFTTYTWDGYREEMLSAANGVCAAGLEPTRDRAINLYYPGHLYGSFISFFSIMEMLRVPQLPMAMVDPEEVVEAIVRFRPNVLFGAPSYILGLFRDHGEALREAGCVEKIFFGGEPMSAAQRAWLTDSFGVRQITSAIYGSNDAGPLAYQCTACEGGVHHVLSDIQTLEIVGLEDDQPVAPGEVGRLIFTPRVAGDHVVRRYEIGDLGRWVEGRCACGREDRRFELLGRKGDAFKLAGPFLNATRFARLLDERLGYDGRMQLHLHTQGRDVALRLLIEPTVPGGPEAAQQALMEAYDELRISVEECGALFTVTTTEQETFEIVGATGKMRAVCDHRFKGETVS